MYEYDCMSAAVVEPVGQKANCSLKERGGCGDCRAGYMYFFDDKSF